MTTTVRPRTPAELAVLVPYQLGYHPGPSVVLTAVHERQFGIVQRHDLVADPDDARTVAAQAVDIVRREGATSLIIIGFDDLEGRSQPLRAAIVAAAGELSIPLQEHIVVRDGRWFAPDCHLDCCPEEGLPLPRPEDVPAVAAFVHAGVAPVPDRQALVRGVLPERDAARAREVGLHLEALGRGSATGAFGGGPSRTVGVWLDHVDEALGCWERLLDPSPQALPVADFADEELALLATSLQDRGWRDALLATVAPGSMPGMVGLESVIELVLDVAYRCPWVPDLAADLDADPRELLADCGDEVLTVRGRFVELARLLPVGATPPVLVVVAHLAWWAGDGTVAGVCLERALEIDPEHRLAGLMAQLLSAGLRPWDEPATPPGTAEDEVA